MRSSRNVWALASFSSRISLRMFLQGNFDFALSRFAFFKAYLAQLSLKSATLSDSFGSCMYSVLYIPDCIMVTFAHAQLERIHSRQDDVKATRL